MISKHPTKITILAAVDGGADCASVLELAKRAARTVPATELHVVHVVDQRFWTNTPPVPERLLLRRAHRFLDRAIPQPEELRIIRHVVSGQPADRILALAEEVEAQLVVIGAGKPSLGFGSVATRVARRACCPVLVAREVGYPPTPRIEPPCEACEMTRRASGGSVQWCAQHGSHHPHGHTFSEIPEAFALGSSFLRPEGSAR